MKLHHLVLLCIALVTMPYTMGVGESTDGIRKLGGTGNGTRAGPSAQCPWSTTSPDTMEQRIIGGDEAKPGDFPFFVGWFDLMTGLPFCGGTLIHEDIILTAAHCDPTRSGIHIRDTFLVIGAYSLNPDDTDEANSDVRLLDYYMVHPDYNDVTKENDVMVLKITYNSSLPTIALNGKSVCPNAGDDLIAIGLGDTNADEIIDEYPDTLLKVTVPAVAHDECTRDSAEFDPDQVIVENVMMCAYLEDGGKDVCQGDSGGPLLAFHDDDYVQVGITSFGYGCAEPDAPGVYTRISGVKSWIEEKICQLSDNPPASCAAQCPWSSTPPDTMEQRIIGGDEAKPGEFLFFVGWFYKGNGIKCGGTLIHEDIILTAAHCNPALYGDRIEDTFLIIGAYSLNPDDADDADSDTRLIEKAVPHPDWGGFETFLNDVMVLKIAYPSSLPTIALNDIFACPNAGDDLIAIGLGDTNAATINITESPDTLLKVTLPAIAHDECAVDIAREIPGQVVVEDVMLCAGLDEGGKDVCKGDSGGPLLAFHDGEYVQVGITSFSPKPCAQADAPAVYTRISGVIKSWIDEQICELSDNKPASCG